MIQITDEQKLLLGDIGEVRCSNNFVIRESSAGTGQQNAAMGGKWSMYSLPVFEWRSRNLSDRLTAPVFGKPSLS